MGDDHHILCLIVVEHQSVCEHPDTNVLHTYLQIMLRLAVADCFPHAEILVDLTTISITVVKYCLVL